MSENMKPSLWDQLWAAIWNWLERHDSLAASIVGAILTGAIAILGWRTRQIRERQKENRAAALDQERQIASWRRRVDQELDMLRSRATKTEGAVKHITSQIGEVILRLGRVDERHQQSEERSSEADARIERRIEETNAAVRDVSRGVQAILLRNRRVDATDDDGPDH